MFNRPASVAELRSRDVDALAVRASGAGRHGQHRPGGAQGTWDSEKNISRVILKRVKSKVSVRAPGAFV